MTDDQLGSLKAALGCHSRRFKNEQPTKVSSMHFKTVVTTKRLTRLLSNVKATSTAVSAFIRQDNTWWVERIDCNSRKSNDEQCLLLRMNILPITGIECIFFIHYKDCGCLETYLLIFTDLFFCVMTCIHVKRIIKKDNKCRCSTCRRYFDGGRSEWEVCCLLKVWYFDKKLQSKKKV